jgi:bifunctional non-homologous end joining protein LigD
MTEQKNRAITLYCQSNGSDKVYTMQIDKVEGGYQLICANAKRGATLKPRPHNKTKSPKARDFVEALYDSVYKEKTSAKKGYQLSVDGGDTLLVDNDAGKDSGIRTQGLNKISEAMAIDLCHDPLWGAQEKHDGENRPLLIENKTVRGTNRYGEFTGGMKKSVAEGIDLRDDMILGTEDCGDTLYAFDLFSYRGTNMRDFSYQARYEQLQDALTHHQSVQLSPLATTTEQKLALLERLRTEKGEGIVFKRLSASHTAGKPSSGGDMLKFKFYEEASFLVIAQNTQRSVQMAVLDEQGVQVPVGNVTISANKGIPVVGSVIQVRYRYANKGGKIYEPSFERVRTDQRVEECRQSQLVYKRVA